MKTSTGSVKEFVIMVYNAWASTYYGIDSSGRHHSCSRLPFGWFSGLTRVGGQLGKWVTMESQKSEVVA